MSAPLPISPCSSTTGRPSPISRQASSAPSRPRKRRTGKSVMGRRPNAEGAAVKVYHAVRAKREPPGDSTSRSGKSSRAADDRTVRAASASDRRPESKSKAGLSRTSWCFARRATPTPAGGGSLAQRRPLGRTEGVGDRAVPAAAVQRDLRGQARVAHQAGARLQVGEDLGVVAAVEVLRGRLDTVSG